MRSRSNSTGSRGPTTTCTSTTGPPGEKRDTPRKQELRFGGQGVNHLAAQDAVLAVPRLQVAVGAKRAGGDVPWQRLAQVLAPAAETRVQHRNLEALAAIPGGLPTVNPQPCQVLFPLPRGQAQGEGVGRAGFFGPRMAGRERGGGKRTARVLENQPGQGKQQREEPGKAEDCPRERHPDGARQKVLRHGGKARGQRRQVSLGWRRDHMPDIQARGCGPVSRPGHGGRPQVSLAPRGERRPAVGPSGVVRRPRHNGVKTSIIKPPSISQGSLLERKSVGPFHVPGAEPGPPP
jgi:hypothetical protein